MRSGSTAPPPGGGPWRREPAAGYQAGLDARPIPPLNSAPEGRARIETYTVMHGRGGGPELGVVIGRLEATGERFLANTPSDAATFAALEDEEGVGRTGRVETRDGRGVFRLDGRPGASSLPSPGRRRSQSM